MPSSSEYMARANTEDRLLRADELRAGSPDRQLAIGRASTRRVRRAAIRMALMRRSRRADDVVVPADGGEALGSQREQQ